MHTISFDDVERVVGYVLNQGNDGCTYDFRSGTFVEVSQGYAVSADRICVLGPSCHKSSSALASILFEILSHAGPIEDELHLGLWMSGLMIHVDLVEIIQDLDEAIRIGMRRNEEAIYDFANQRDIYLD